MTTYFSGVNSNKNVGVFGINYLDKTLYGIGKGDLILIGSRSGAGKSTIANSIAIKNRNRCKVSLFSLENFEDDLEMHVGYLKFLELTKRYDVSERAFMQGGANSLMTEEIVNEIDSAMDAAFKGLHVFHRQPNFTIEKLVDAMMKEKEAGCELLIIDHLDYVEKDAYDLNDNIHQTMLMKTIRQVQDETKMAVVAISHLRKPMFGQKLFKIPSMDEFIGSSNKVKEATVVIMFAPDDEMNELSTTSARKATFCCIRKNRFGGFRNEAARLYYDLKRGQYEDAYEVLSVNYTGSEIKELRNEI